METAGKGQLVPVALLRTNSLYQGIPAEYKIVKNLVAAGLETGMDSVKTSPVTSDCFSCVATPKQLRCKMPTETGP